MAFLHSIVFSQISYKFRTPDPHPRTVKEKGQKNRFFLLLNPFLDEKYTPVRCHFLSKIQLGSGGNDYNINIIFDI